jgi:hypothetical protein
LQAAFAWEDWIYNLTRPFKTLRVAVNDGRRRWQPRSPAMAAGLTDYIWTVRELLMMVVSPDAINTEQGDYQIFRSRKKSKGHHIVAL